MISGEVVNLVSTVKSDRLQNKIKLQTQVSKI